MFRLTIELSYLQGIQTTFPYQQKRIVKITKEDIVTLLTTENPFLKRMSSDTCDQLANIGEYPADLMYFISFMTVLL